MVRKLLCGALATMLLGQVSIAFADDATTFGPGAMMHYSRVINFPGFKSIKWEQTFTSHSGYVTTESGSACVNRYTFGYGKEAIDTGVMHFDWFIERADGEYDLIEGYDVVFTGNDGIADHAEPPIAIVDMSSYVDYPACNSDAE